VVRAEDLQVVVEDLTSRPFFYKRLQQSLVRYRCRYRLAADPGGSVIQALHA